MWSGGCKEHPETKQLPGVCSSCLRDRLSQLDLHSNHKPISPSDSSLNSDSPAEGASSNYVSQAAHRRRGHHRNASDVMDSASSSMLSFDYGLKKSRSIAFASRNEASGSCTRKKDGFWSKLLKLTRKGTKNVLMHSGTIREGQG